MVVGALAIQMATTELARAIVSGSEAHETVCQRIVPLFMHVVMANHVRLVRESLQNTDVPS